MKEILLAYVSGELVTNQALLPIRPDTSLIEKGILDSLSLLKLALFLEERFGVTVEPEDLTPDNFGTIDAIDAYLQSRNQEEGAQA